MARKSHRNPFWVTPEGTAGGWTEESGGHGRYTDKHGHKKSRGPVPRFMERQVRVEAPREKPAKGWTIIEREVSNQYGRPETRFLLKKDGRDTGRYALDWNKAAALTHLLVKKGGKWCKRKGARKNPSARRNPLDTGYVKQALSPLSYSQDGTIRRNPAVYSNPAPSGCSRDDWLCYYREGKAKGRTPKQIRALWARKKKAAQKRDAVKRGPAHYAAREIYDLADKVLGTSDFLHTQGSLDTPDDHTLRLDLPKAAGTGWNISGVDRSGKALKEFAKGVRKIGEKYRKAGLVMTVARLNPGARSNPDAKQMVMAIAGAIAEAVSEEGAAGAPESYIFLALESHGLPHAFTKNLIDSMVRAGRLKRRNNRLYVS